MMKKADEIIVQHDNAPSMSSSFLDKNTLLVTYVGAINENFVSILVGYLNEFSYNSFILMMNSPGGDASMITPAVTVLKQMGLKEIIGFGQSSSACLAILVESKKQDISVSIDPLCHCVLHRCSSYMSEARSERMEKYITKFVKEFENTFDVMNKEIIDNLSEEDKVEYKLGMDCYIMGFSLIQWGVFKEFSSKTFKSFAINARNRKPSADKDHLKKALRKELGM